MSQESAYIQKVLNQETATNSTSTNVDRVNSDGYLDFKCGSCPLSLEDGTLTIHAGKMEFDPAATEDANRIFELLQSDAVTAINVGDGVVFPNPPENGGLNSIFMIASHVTPIRVSKGAILPDNSATLFALIPNVTSIIFEDGIDSTNVTNMEGMFAWVPKLESLDLSGLDTRNVTDMSAMFQQFMFPDPDQNKLKKITFGSKFNTSNVTDMGVMFAGNRDLKSLDLSGFDTSNVTNMSGMFLMNDNLKSLDISSFDTRKAVGLTTSGGKN